MNRWAVIFEDDSQKAQLSSLLSGVSSEPYISHIEGTTHFL